MRGEARRGMGRMSGETFTHANLRGPIWRGGARYGVAGHGLARSGTAWAAHDDAIFIGADLQGGAGRGMSGFSMAG